MLIALSLTLLALRSGLEMRRRRLSKRPGDRKLRSRHLLLAKVAVALVLLALLSGPASSYFLRDWTPLQTLHGWVGLGAALAFGSTGFLGRKLEAGSLEHRELHARFALLCALSAGLAFATGFVLLP